MKIWVDADACPKVIKDILYRLSERTAIELVLVANAALVVPRSPYIKSVRVSAGFDVADNYIVKALESGDIVVTADIPLAAEVVEANAIAINPRGDLYTRENIRQRLQMRNFMEELRNSGENLGGPGSFSHKDRQQFANQIDKLITRQKSDQ